MSSTLTVACMTDVLNRMVSLLPPSGTGTGTGTGSGSGVCDDSLCLCRPDNLSGFGWASGLYVSAVVECYDEKNFLDKIKGMVLPVVGLVYAGVQTIHPSLHTAPKTSHRIGMDGEFLVSIVVACQSDVFVQADFKTPTMNVLGLIRAMMRDSRGPGGHFWRFVSESPAVLKNSVSVYVQTWALPISLMNP